MSKIYKFFIFSFLLLILTGCAGQHQISLVDFNSDEILTGIFDERDDSVIVTMPNGEVLKGNYSSISNDNAITFGNSFGYSSGRYRSGGFGGIGLGFNFGADSTKYALLTSEISELKMEIIMTIRSWSKDGFGEAKTNDGRVYKIQF